MKCTAIPEALQQMVKQMPYVTMATVCADGAPWNTPLYAKLDDSLNVYWVSWQHNQHSQNIARDPRVFIVVYDTNAPAGQGQGLYMQMQAQELTTKEQIEFAKNTYDPSFFTHDGMMHEQFLGECPQRFYKASPVAIWYNDDSREKGHFIDIRRSI